MLRKDPEARKQYEQEYRRKNKEKIRKRQSEWTQKNKEALKEKQAIYRANNPDIVKRAQLKFHYGATLEEFKVLESRAGGTCEICGNLPGNTNQTKLHLDHNHETGQLRGILCH